VCEWSYHRFVNLTTLESLRDSQWESVRKISTERMQGWLVKAEDKIFDTSHLELMERLANVMLKGHSGTD